MGAVGTYSAVESGSKIVIKLVINATAIQGCKLTALWCYEASWHDELQEGIVRGKRTSSKEGRERGRSHLGENARHVHCNHFNSETEGISCLPSWLSAKETAVFYTTAYIGTLSAYMLYNACWWYLNFQGQPPWELKQYCMLTVLHLSLHHPGDGELLSDHSQNTVIFHPRCWLYHPKMALA